MSRPQKGDTLQLTIQQLSEKGHGQASVESTKITVPGALPQEEVRVQVVHSRRKAMVARLDAVVQASPDRVVPQCQHVDACGGCTLQHWAYPAQVQWREAQLQALFATAGIKVPPLERVVMEDPFAFRSKLELTFAQLQGGVGLGFHRAGSFSQIVDVEHCRIAPEPMQRVLSAVKQAVNQHALPAYNPRTHQGFWRYAVMRAAKSSSQVILMLVTQSGHDTAVQAAANQVVAQVPELVGVVRGISEKLADIAVPETVMCLAGEATLPDQLGRLQFRLDPTNFAQPNRCLVQQAYDSVLEFAHLTGREAVYDLYCGVGLMSLFLADQAQFVCGVESAQENIVSAKATAAANGVDNALFVCAKVEDVLRGQSLFKLGPPPDVVVLDPPRMGLHKDVYAPLLKARPKRMVYLSCNPGNLVRDLTMLMTQDPAYRVGAVRWFDFFPHTAHKEVLICLER